MQQYITIRDMIVMLLMTSVLVELVMMIGICRMRRECREIKKIIKPYMKSMWLENGKQKDTKEEWKTEQKGKCELPKGIEFTPEEEKIIREVLQEYMI